MNLTISRTTSRAGIARRQSANLIAGLAIATAVFVGLSRSTDAPVAAHPTSHIAAAPAAIGDNSPRIVYIVSSEMQKTALALLAQAELPNQPEFVIADSTQPEHYVYRAEDVPSGVKVIDLR